MIKRISSGGEFEAKVGFCRAVVAGGWVHVAGTIGRGETVTDQCRDALNTIHAALVKAGAEWADVVRVTYILPDPEDFEPCWPMLRDTFAENPPAATMISCALIEPQFRIEIEVTALLPA